MIRGLSTAILMISLLLIGITVASVISSQTIVSSENCKYDQNIDETLNEILTYIIIKDQNGKFHEINGEQRIDKIALFLTPLISTEIDMSKLVIQLKNRETVMFLIYDGHTENLETNSIFDHPIWHKINGNNFGIISIIDFDESLVNYSIFNDCSDNAYVVFKLPDDITLAKYEKLTVTLFPSVGITVSTILKAPLPITPVITFK
jgi:archaellin